MGQPRIVGVDYGQVRVGLAVADPLSLFAQPLGAFSPESAVAELEQIRARDGIGKVVLGWPLELDGTEGESVQAVRAFEKRLKKALPGVEVERWDERLSSREAASAMVASGARKSKRREKGNIDAVAAAIILQSYLDGVERGSDSSRPSQK